MKNSVIPKKEADQIKATVGQRPYADCRVCGGEGWTEGSETLRRDGHYKDTTCIACDGTGREKID